MHICILYKELSIHFIDLSERLTNIYNLKPLIMLNHQSFGQIYG